MNWFQRHLNWSFFLGTMFLPFLVSIVLFLIFFPQFYGGFANLEASGAGESELSQYFVSTYVQFLAVWLVVGLALTVFVFLVTWWYLGQKARSKWFLLLLFAPFGFIILLLLENRAIGYGGDFVGEPVAERWPDTGQFSAPDDWQPKELDYSPAKNLQDIAYGGAVKDVRDVDVPSEEGPAAFPPRVLEGIPAEASAETPPEVFVEAAVETRAEATPEVPTEIPAEVSAGAAAEVPVEAKVTEEAVRQEALTMPILLDDAGAVIKCFYHPDANAVNLCSRCRHYVCSQCNYVTGTHPICRNCWEKRAETPILPVSPESQKSPKLSKSEKRKAEEDERLREFMQLYEQALPIISTVIKKGAEGLTASPFELMEGVKLHPVLEQVRNLPKPREKELQEAEKEFEQLLLACIKVADTAGGFVSSGGQAVPSEADLASFDAEIATVNGLNERLSQRLASHSQSQE